MGDLHFRDASDTDIPAIVELVTSAYRGEASRQGWTTEADLLEGQRIDPEVLAGDLRRPESIVLLASTSGGDTSDAAASALIGCAHLSRASADTAYFGMFAVRPGTQGTGLGKAILAEAERRASAEWGAATVEMTVIEQRSDLITFYERRGYRRTGELRPFPYGDARFGIPLRDDLRMVVLAKTL
jgi:ribosomal protein S18 acetylase RimI-like enzyme